MYWMSALIIYMTCESHEQAEHIVQDLLGSSLIACANIMQPHTALYSWEGQIEKEQETGVILKTSANMFAAVEKRVKELHSYECPCLVSIAVDGGHAPFLEWIEAQVKS
jgi:periplasmic divalent cation tolerance protein